MGLERRTYQRFEAGEGELKVERIFSFAQATDTDPYALLASVRLGSVDFALACADNKLALLFVAHARDLFEREGGDVRLLTPQSIVEVLAFACARLRAELEDLPALRAKWLSPPF